MTNILIIHDHKLGYGEYSIETNISVEELTERLERFDKDIIDKIGICLLGEGDSFKVIDLDEAMAYRTQVEFGE